MHLFLQTIDMSESKSKGKASKSKHAEIIDLTSIEDSPQNNRNSRVNQNSRNEDNLDDDLNEQLFLIQAKVVGKRFYNEKLNNGELIYLSECLYSLMTLNYNYITLII